MEDAFSTLELLLTIAFLGVLAFASAPIRGRSVAFHLHREAFALSAAIESGATGGPLWGSPTRLTIKQHGYSKELASGTKIFHAFHPRISASVDEAQVLTFYPSGVTTPHTLRLTADQYSCTLRVSLRGRVTTECL